MSKKKIIIWSSIISLLVLAVALVLIFGVFKHEHKWSEWQTSKVATCTQDGINIRVCDDCGESQNVPISAIGHTWSEWSITKEAFCTQDGSKERICYCGEKESQTISALGHTFSAWNTTKEATCTVKGSKERSCSCGEKEVWATSALGHNFSAWNTTKEATCLVDGSKERTCFCGEKEVQKILASGHTWKNATCTTPRKCSKCNTVDGEKLGHTCERGYCQRCHEYVTIEVELPKTPIEEEFYVYYLGSEYLLKAKVTSLSWKFHFNGNAIYLCYQMELTAIGAVPDSLKEKEFAFSFDFVAKDSNGVIVEKDGLGSGNIKIGEKMKSERLIDGDTRVVEIEDFDWDY